MDLEVLEGSKSYGMLVGSTPAHPKFFECLLGVICCVFLFHCFCLALIMFTCFRISFKQALYFSSMLFTPFTLKKGNINKDKPKIKHANIPAIPY